MSHWTSRWSMVWNRTQRFGSDSLLLVSKLARSPSRDVLISQAQKANTLATSLLRVEREANLIRYHGFLGYFRNVNTVTRKLGFSSSSKSLKGAETQTTPAPSKNVARVAFMITTSQRLELSERLGFTPDQIKALKPLEATLILDHSLLPVDVETKLPSLVQDYRSSLVEQKKSLEEATASLATKEQRFTGAGLQDPKADDASANSKITTASLPLLQSSESTRLWHEVVEIKSGTTQTIGLFQCESEAKLLQETKQGLAEKFSPDESVIFEIRATRK